MAKTKARKPKLALATDLAAAIGVTVERFRRDDWTRNKPEVRDGARIEHPPRVLSRVQTFVRLGWTNNAGGASLALYEALTDASGYGHTRSCIDMSPRGGSGDTPGKVIRARNDLAKARNAVVSSGVPIAALALTDALLGSCESMEDATRGLVAGGRDRRMAEARAMVGAVAAALVDAFATKRAA